MSASLSPISSYDEPSDLILADILRQVAGILSDLSFTCADLQKLQPYNTGITLDTEQVIKGQALDRVTQTLECISALNDALSQISVLGNATVSHEILETIKLPSVRALIKGSDSTAAYDPVDIDLF